MKMNFVVCHQNISQGENSDFYFDTAPFGCVSTSSMVHHTSPHWEIPLDVVLTIPSHLDSLQSGMTPTQVLATLGLSSYQLGGDCSGPTSRFTCQLFLRPDFELTLVYDLRPAPSFLRASLVGAGCSKQ